MNEQLLTPEASVFDIKRYTVHDGPGIRTTIFLKGCPLRCWWCHNPEGQDPKPHSASDTQDKTNVMIMTPGQLLAEIEKDVLFYDESGGGVTFSGGEPLMQHQFLHSILPLCKTKHIHTALDTCGYAPPEVVRSVSDKVDLFLYDLKLVNEQLHLRYTGASNRSILENLRMLDEIHGNIVIRFPTIPQITDTDENIAAVADFVSSLRTIREIHLLPYHNLARAKYARLKLQNNMSGVPPPPTENIEAIKRRFEHLGFHVRVGG